MELSLKWGVGVGEAMVRAWRCVAVNPGCSRGIGIGTYKG